MSQASAVRLGAFGGSGVAALASIALWLAPIAVATGLAWTYADSYLHPTFAGDQGTRLDQADQIVVVMGPRQWLPFLQVHLHLLYLARAPVPAYLLVPFAYTVATLFLLAALCRATLREPRQALVATLVLLVGFAGSSFHWLGRSLYQETLLLPFFLALVYLHYFAPQRRALFVTVFAAGLLTREVFWIWWFTYVALHWRNRLRTDPALRLWMLALALIPAGWLLYTRQSVLLSRNTPAGELLLEGIAGRAGVLGQTLLSEWVLPSMACLVAIYAIAVAQRGLRGLAFRSYHIFALVSLAITYGYILLLDPWQTTPGNTRALVPLFAHVLVWWVIAWHEARRLQGRAGTAARMLVVAGMLSLLKLNAIATTVVGPAPTRPAGWEPLKLTTHLPAAGSWRDTLGNSLEPIRRAKAGPLDVVLISSERSEYRKLWVAPFLYDRRHQIALEDAVPQADVAIAPEGYRAPGWVLRTRLHMPHGLVRDVLVPAP